MMDLRSRSYYTAAITRFEAQRDEAIATLELYITSAVGIGDHSNLLDEIEKWTEALASADEKIGSLKRYFGGKKTAARKIAEGL